MPTDPIAVVVYLLLLIPGVVFVQVRERHQASIKRSAFRETAVVAMVSAGTLTLVFMIALGARINSPEWGKILIELARNPQGNYLEDPARFIYLLVGAIVAASVVAGCLASQWWHSLMATLGELVAEKSGNEKIRLHDSGWSDVFEEEPHLYKVVGVYLNKGTYIQGRLGGYNPNSDDDPNRALVLIPPFAVAPNWTARPQVVDRMDRVVINASEVSYLEVSYFEPPSEEAKDAIKVAVE